MCLPGSFDSYLWQNIFVTTNDQIYAIDQPISASQEGERNSETEEREESNGDKNSERKAWRQADSGGE